MADNSNPPYECTLSPELIQKAQEELNEKAEWRLRDIQALRDMVVKNTQLQIRTDDAFLLRFLRAKKFDYDRAYQLILTHYKMRIEHKEAFQNLRPSAVKHVLEGGVTGILPHRDKEGRTVIMFRPGKWDPERYPIDDVFRTNFMTMMKIIQEEETQINGIIMVMDMKELGWAHAKQVSIFYVKRVMSLLQDAFPARLKGIHYLNEPTVFDYIFGIAKRFMKPKTVSRLHFHGSNLQEMREFIDEEYLPEDFGGKAPNYSNKDWMETLLQCDAEFDEESKYGLLDGVLKSSSGADPMDCLAGSYRKLSVE